MLRHLSSSEISRLWAIFPQSSSLYYEIFGLLRVFNQAFNDLFLGMFEYEGKQVVKSIHVVDQFLPKTQ